MQENNNPEVIIYLSIVEYTSQRIPPVQYINMFAFSLSTFDKGSEAVIWKARIKEEYINSH